MELQNELMHKRGMLVLGAGVPMSCNSGSETDFPSWNKLLYKLAGKLQGGDLTAFESAMNNSRLLDAAQIIVDQVSKSQLHQILLDVFNHRNNEPSELYSSIGLIDQPVVLTTNYDRMLEVFWDSLPNNGGGHLMVSRHSDNDIVDHLRSGRNVLVKLHGSIDKVNEIVLSRSQYARARTGNSEFYKVISALMLTRTMLFIGCGFNGDPDIDLLLEDSAFTARSDYPHFALLPSGRHSSEINAIRNSYNIKILEYDAPCRGHDDGLFCIDSNISACSNRDYQALMKHVKDLSKMVQV